MQANLTGRLHAPAIDMLIDYIDSQLGKIETPKIIVDIKNDTLSAANAEKREAWQRLRAGFEYLKEGAPNRQPGYLTTALEKSCLANCFMAASMNVRNLEFKHTLYDLDGKTPLEATLLLCEKLIDRCEKAIPRHYAGLGMLIEEADLLPAFGATPAADLKKMFDAAAAKGQPQFEAYGIKQLDDVRDQMRISLDLLAGAYTADCALLKEQIRVLPATLQLKNNNGGGAHKLII